MFLSKISIRRPVMITMIILVFIIFGAMAFLSLNLDMMPSIDVPYITIQTIYPGAGPKEVETQITEKLEDAISTVSNIDEINSYSMGNVCYVILKFKMGTDADVANQEVKDKVDAIVNQLPSDAELPVISKLDIGSEAIISFILTGDRSTSELYEIANNKIKDQFAQIGGVANVEITGGTEREFQVEMDNSTVYENSISLRTLGQILAAQNMNMPGGSYSSNDMKYSVRLDGELKNKEDIESVKIPTRSGLKRLKNIAIIKDTIKDVSERTIFFDNLKKERNENVVRVSIVKSSEGNAVKVANEIKEKLPEIKKIIPDGTQFDIINDDSIFIQSSVDDTLMNLILGIALTALILLFFLHDFRSTIIVALAMPISIISTFMLMQAFGLTTNMMSLMGLSTSVGILVVNSVVVIENIFRHKKLGHNKVKSADIGASEIASAVVASTLTNLVVFLPIATMSSIVGQFFREFGLTVTFATIFSLIISFTLTPMLASIILPDKQKKNKIGKKMDDMFDAFDNFYGRIISYILNRKFVGFLVVLSSILLLVFTFVLSKEYVGFDFIPMLDEGNITVTVELPAGYELNKTAEKLEEIEKIVNDHKEVKHTLTNIGSTGDLNTGTNLAKMNIKLIDAEKRNITTNSLNNILIREFSTITNAKIKSSVQSSAGGSGNPIEFYLVGSDREKLNELSKELIEKSQQIDGLLNFDSSIKAGKPEISLIPKRRELYASGLTVFDLAMTLRAGIEGIVVSQLKNNNEEYDIRVLLNENDINSPEKIKNLVVVGNRGKYRINQLAEIKYTESTDKIIHKDKVKAIEFTGAPAIGIPLGNITSQINNVISKMNIPTGYSIIWGGDSLMMKEANADFSKTLLLAIVLTYMLLAAMLESFTEPLMILATLPLAMIGVLFSSIITGQSMNIFSIMAIIMLVGIVVNNAILLLDYTKQLMKEGKTVKDALIEACPTKLKPIIMSSLAIMLGMLPMALGIGSAGKEFRQSMGIVSIGGILVSTILTLIIIPIVFELSKAFSAGIKKALSEKS